MKIHIIGASGSGTTTLGKALAHHLGIPHYDGDDFFWMQTDPPFTIKHPREDRITLLESTLSQSTSWVLSGSVMGWGDFILPDLDLIIYKHVAKEVRLQRIVKRERERFGNRIDEGGDMHHNHKDFLAWASAFDTGGLEMRSRQSVEAWMSLATCKIIRLEGDLSSEQEVAKVMKQGII
jgi:adenylate kinase family enzyme